MPMALRRSVSFVNYLRLSLPMYTQDNRNVFNTSTNGPGMPADLALPGRGSGGHGGGFSKRTAHAGDGGIVEVRASVGQDLLAVVKSCNIIILGPDPQLKSTQADFSHGFYQSRS